MLAEPRRLQSRLNVHFEVHQVRDELRVRLRLVPTAHNPKRHADISFLRKRWNDCVQRPLSPRQRIWRIWIQAEESAAIVERKTSPRGNDARSKSLVVALDQRNHVSVAVDDAQISRIVSNRDFPRSRVAVGLVCINQL